MRHRSVLFVSLLLIFFDSFAQPLTKFDALKAAVTKSKTPLQKLKALLSFCNEWESYSPDTLKKYMIEAKGLAQSQKDAQALLLSDYYTAVWDFQVNKLDSALSLTNETLNRYKKNFGYDENLAKLYALKGNVLLRTAKMDEMMASDFEWMKVAEDHRDTLSLARAILGIGNVNSRLKKYDETLKWYHEALALMKTPFYKQKLSFIYNNFAIIFYHLNNEDSAMYYVKQGIQFSKEDSNLTNWANGLSLYGGLLAEYKHLPEAEKVLKEEIDVRKQIGDVYYLIADLAQVAMFYADNHQPEKGVAVCKEALALAQKNGNDFLSLNSIYTSLAQCYEAANNYKDYSEALKEELALKDSVYKRSSAEAMADMEGKYELQKKETIIVQQQLDIVRKNYLFYGSLALLLLVVAAAAIILQQNKRRQKLKLRLIQEEEKRTAEIAVMQAEETERKRIAADLHDSLGAYAASIAANTERLQQVASAENKGLLHELKGNVQSIVSQLSDTIWILKKDAQSLTAISDRLKLFIQRLSPSYPSITIDVWEEIETDYLLPPAQAFHLFQIVKEGVNNALRHSHCTQLTVRIESRDGWRISITDDGSGILQNTTLAEGGNGLPNMKQRARESGWKIEWQRNQPRGTKVIIEPTTN